MSSSQTPFISPQQNLPEITPKVVVLAILLAALLALSNAYLALKIGILTSASIPAAVISMGIFRFFKNSNILENNLVQTAASAGAAVAGGIVYTIPALVIIQYWNGFSYLQNVCIALIGGILGVFFSIPFRRMLMKEESLQFPEGRAIAELLKTSATNVVGFAEMIWGGIIGASLELMQTGFKLIASSWQHWINLPIHSTKSILVGVGIGFSPTMIGVGYLIGFNIALSILAGALISWVIGVPVMSYFYPSGGEDAAVTSAMTLWGTHNRYVAIGGMLVAGVWTLLPLLKPLYLSLKTSFQTIRKKKSSYLEIEVLRTERDIPMLSVFLALIVLMLALYVFFYFYLPISALELSGGWQAIVYGGSGLYVLIMGFIISVISAYFSGLVGFTASPGSSVIIASMFLAALLLFSVLQAVVGPALTSEHIRAAEAIVIIAGAVITGAAAISNDNIQDLKVGHILGATPWCQQVMLIIGVIVSALVIPPVIQMLFNVYGIAGVVPRPDMDPTQTLPAPPAALMAAVTQAVFRQSLPWHLVGIGAGLTIALIAITHWIQKNFGRSLSILGIAVGMYLPLVLSVPLFIGGFIAWLTQQSGKKWSSPEADPSSSRLRRGILLACGLVAGSALMDVMLALPFSMAGNPNILQLVPATMVVLPAILGAATLLGLSMWFWRITR